MKEINLSYEEVIEHLKNLKDHHVSFDENRAALSVAITEVGKCIYAKPTDNGLWSPKTCPTCGEHLSEHEGDGYYRDLQSLESCPKCRQLLKWN